jgi:hypothetical protein
MENISTWFRLVRYHKHWCSSLCRGSLPSSSAKPPFHWRLSSVRHLLPPGSPRELQGGRPSPCLRTAAALGGQTLLRPCAICALCFPVLLATAGSFTLCCHPTKGLMTRQCRIDLITHRMGFPPGRDEGPHHGGAGWVSAEVLCASYP